MAQLQLTDTQDCPLSVKITDKKGNPAPVENPTWASSDVAVATVTPDAADPLKAVVSAVGPTGTAEISFDADADMGAGVQDIIGTLSVVVLAGPATVVEIAAGAPTEQSATPAQG